MSASTLATLRPSLLLRLQFIECLLAHYGSVNRVAIMDFFALGPAQASRDLRAYLALAPGNAVYDLGARTYLRGAGFKRVWPVGEDAENLDGP